MVVGKLHRLGLRTRKLQKLFLIASIGFPLYMAVAPTLNKERDDVIMYKLKSPLSI